MSLRPFKPLLAAIAVSGVATLAFAQAEPKPTTPPHANSGTGTQVTHPSQVDKSQNNILPSAGSSGQSAAPTMVYDCEKRPQECSVTATPSDKAGASRTNPIKP